MALSRIVMERAGLLAAVGMCSYIVVLSASDSSSRLFNTNYVLVLTYFLSFSLVEVQFNACILFLEIIFHIRM